jgi:hypothetical protein
MIPATRGFDEVQERWAMAQVQAILQDIVAWARGLNRLFLVDPEDERRLPKMRQLVIARDYFKIPVSEVVIGCAPSLKSDSSVVKSLAPAGFLGGKFLFTKRVDTSRLSLEWPWFIQGEQFGHDVTVLVVRHELFASSLSRATFDGEDWRKHIYGDTPLRWVDSVLSSDETERIMAFMAKAKLVFGRLDFIRRDDGELVFLEVNTNGEWGWLDEDGRRGIFAAVWHSLRSFVVSGP